ncbi:hypothetical protein DENSPDRAFT_785716, partial [Dentipellis sp. KUC8613]
VTWLRTKARYNRWCEQMVVLPFEMQWTIASFENSAELWCRRAEQSQRNNFIGHQAYARRQEAMWRQFAGDARKAFIETIGEDSMLRWGLPGEEGDEYNL